MTQPVIYIELEGSSFDFMLEDGSGKILNEQSGWNLPGGPGDIWTEFTDADGTWTPGSTGDGSWAKRPGLSDIWTEFPDPSGTWEV